MADMMGDMPEQKSLQLNPEILEKVAPADRDAIELVECLVREHPWHVRMGEGVLHHLAGELAGIAIGTSLVLCGFPQINHAQGPKSQDPLPALRLCIESQLIAAPSTEDDTTRQTRWLVLGPCPRADDTAHADRAATDAASPSALP